MNDNLTFYISGGDKPAIGAFWMDSNGSEHAMLEPVYANTCFGASVTDGAECIKALNRIKKAYRKAGGMGFELAYWEIFNTPPEARGALYTAFKVAGVNVLPTESKEEVYGNTEPQLGVAMFPTCRREICLTGTAYSLLCAREKWHEWQDQNGVKNEDE